MNTFILISKKLSDKEIEQLYKQTRKLFGINDKWYIRLYYKFMKFWSL